MPLSRQQQIVDNKLTKKDFKRINKVELRYYKPLYKGAI